MSYQKLISVTRVCIVLGCVLMAWGYSPAANAQDDPMNVLYLVVDDLRVDSRTQTPNIDALAARGTFFTNAYTPVPVCGSARAAFLSGVLQVRGQNSPHNANPPNVTTLPDTFRAAGYDTGSWGKVYHNATSDANAWSEGVWRADTSWLHWQTQSPADPNTGRGPAFEQGIDVADNFYSDGQTADQIVSLMPGIANDSDPFFMAVGFDRPHLPFNAPQQYWDLYDPADIVLPTDRSAPANSPGKLKGSTEITQYGGIPNMSGSHNTDGNWSDELRRNLIHGYLASTSYTDAQLGRVLDSLDDPNGDGDTSDSMRDNTIIVMVSDHGWLLGEHGMWGKHNLLDQTLNVPMLIVDPRREGGNVSDALVSAMDLYPTLASLAGLDLPGHVEGNDLTQLLTNPDRPWAEYVYSHFNGGDSIRTERYRYIQWTDGQEALFDLQADPGEAINIIGSASSEILAEVRGVLQQHFDNGFEPISLMDGDLDGDGSVSASDLDIIFANWGQSVAPGSYFHGDINLDGVVGQADLNAVLDNWSNGSPPDVNVPEPTSALGLGGAVLFTLMSRPRH